MMLYYQLARMRSLEAVHRFFAANLKYVKLFFIVFYIGGLIGLMYPASHHLFTKLIPYALLLSFFTAMFYQKTAVGLRVWLVLSLVFVCGYWIEVLGVNTGLVFGRYSYGNGLGCKVFNTPLIIGLNWAFMVYFTSSVCRSLGSAFFPSVVLPSLLMLAYDFILEQSASWMDMWYWADGRIPLQNYIAWLVISFLFHLLLRSAKLDVPNKLSGFILLCQSSFFAVLYLFKGIVL